MPFELPRFDEYLPGYGSPLTTPRRKVVEEEQAEPGAVYDKLTPTQKAWVDKQIELEARPRSALGEIGTGIARGALVELPRLVGQGLKATGVEGDALYGIGTKLVAGAESREPSVAEDINPDAHNAVTRAFAQGGSMLAPSLAPLAALPVLAAAGAPAAVGLAAAGAAGAGLFGAAQYQDTYEKAIKEGKTPEEAHSLGLQTGAVEAAGESVGTFAAGKFITGTAKVLGRKYTVDQALVGLRDPKFLKTFARDLAQTGAVEVGTEMGQAYGEAAIENNAGIDKTTAWDAATSAIGPTMAMTAFLGPLGALGIRARQQRNAQLLRQVESPDTDFTATSRAMRELAPQMEPLVGREEMNNWRLDVLTRASDLDFSRGENATVDARRAKQQADQEAQLAQASQGEEIVAANAAAQQRAADIALLSKPPEGAMGFAEYAKEQGRQPSLSLTQKGKKITQETLQQGYLNYLREYATQANAEGDTGVASPNELERAGQSRLFADRGEGVPGAVEQPFTLEPSPRQGGNAEAVETIPFEQRNDKQAELDLMPVMNRPVRETPLDRKASTETKQPTVMEQAFAAAGGKKRFEMESAYAQHRAQLEAVKKGSEATKAAVIDKIARVAAANKQADDAMAGRINGNTPVAVSDLLRVWEQETVAAGIDPSVFKGQVRAKLMMAIKSAGGKKLWMQQLGALRAARDNYGTETTSYETLDRLIKKLENFNGEAAPVREEGAGQGSAQTGKQDAQGDGQGQEALLTKEAKKAAPAVKQQPVEPVNAAPVAEVVSVPPPKATEAPVAAPKPEKEVIVSSVGAERESTRPVGWGESATVAPSGPVTYKTPARSQRALSLMEHARARAGEERFTPARYSAEVPARERRSTDEEKLFGFEILNYNEKAARGTNVNTHWANEYTRALKLSTQKQADGTPTAAAKNAIDALKWLEQYEGADITKRVILRRIEGIFDVNERLGAEARVRAEEIKEQIAYEVDQIAQERKDKIAQGMGLGDADQWTREQLLKINSALAREEAQQRAENRARTKKPTAQEQTKKKQARDEFVRQFFTDLEDVIRGVTENDPKIMNLHAALPNYTPTVELTKAVDSGKVSRVLTVLRATGPSEWTQYLAGTLQGVGLDTKIRSINKVAYDANGERVYARYDHSSNTVNVYIGGHNPHTLLHEIAHAATVARITMGKAAVRTGVRTAEEKTAATLLTDLRAFMAEMKKLDTKNQYAFRNEEEFVAEVLSNEKFQKWLRKQTYQDRTSAWHKFVDWVREMLGLPVQEGANALRHALGLSYEAISDSRFGAAEGLSFNHSATGAMAQTDSIVSSMVQKYDSMAAKSDVLGTLGAKARAGLWHASTTFNIAQWVERIPALKSLVSGMHAYMDADGLKMVLRQTKQMEFSNVTNALKLALAKLPGQQAEAMNQKLMGFAGDMSALTVDLNKNFDENKRANPNLDATNKEYINRRHAEYKQLPVEFKKPLEESFKLFRKNYIQHTTMVLRDVLKIYQSTSPQLGALITLLDIRNPVLNEGTNPRSDYFYDAYSANLDRTLRKVLKEARQASAGKDHLQADLADIAKFYEAAVSNPYMHLGRSGEYYVEFNVKNVPGAWGALQAAVVPYGKAMGAPTQKGHVFLRFENPAQRDALLRDLSKLTTYIEPTSMHRGSLFDSDAMDRMQGVPAFVHRLMRRVDDDFKGEQAAAVRQYLKRAYLDALPDSSAQKALVQRKDGGVAGYDLDFMRNFSKRAEGMASMISNAYALPEYDAAFAAMKEEVSKLEAGGGTAGAADAANQVLTEMSRRFSNSVSPVESPIIDKFKAFGFNYFLSFSPAFWLTNIVQPWHLTLPFLGGRYGFVHTAKEMGHSTAKAFKLIQAAIDSGWAQGKQVGGFYGALMGVLDLTLPVDKTGLSTEERAFVQRLIESGQLDTTQGHELARYASGDSPKLTALTKTLSIGSHYTEVLNRLTAGLAAFNLSMRKDGKGEEYATLRAIDAVRGTQFNYSDSNTARALGRHGVVGKVTPLLASFQQYAFQTLELLVRMTADSVSPIPANASPAEIEAAMIERRAARRGLAGVMVVTSMLAGTLGLPLANAVAAIADRLLGDDDDPMDVKAAYRQWLAGVLGNDVAEAVARGIPRAVLGFDTATRMGLQDVLPGTRFMADRRMLKDKLEAGAFSLMGPAVSAGTSVYTGVNKMLDGQLMDGLIETLPLALKGPVKAIKMEDVGFTTSTGNVLPLEVTPWATAVQTVGFTPSTRAEQSEVNFAFRQRDALLKQRKTRLSNELYKTIEDGKDPTALMQEVMLFNQQNPQYKIEPAAGLRLRAQQRATAEVADIPTLPRYLPTLDRYNYANTK